MICTGTVWTGLKRCTGDDVVACTSTRLERYHFTGVARCHFALTVQCTYSFSLAHMVNIQRSKLDSVIWISLRNLAFYSAASRPMIKHSLPPAPSRASGGIGVLGRN